MANSAKISLMVTSAISIGGMIIMPDKGSDSEISVDPALAKSLLDRGKAQTLGGSDGEDVGDLAQMELGDMTVKQLKVVAKSLDVEDFKSMNKGDLIASIELAEEAAGDN